MILVGLTTACVIVFGIACWHLVRGRNQELFLPAAKLALIVGVPVSALNLAIGSHLGVVITDYQPMKIAATEALWETEQPASFSVFQIGGFSVDDQTPELRHRDPVSPLDPRDRLAERRGAGDESAPGRVRGGVRGGELHPAGSDDVLEHADHGLRRLARLLRPRASAAFFYRRRTLVTKPWLLWVGVATIPLPYVAALAGWVLTEVGRQPWIVFGLLKTVDANSPSVSTTTIAFSLGVVRSCSTARSRVVDVVPHASLRAPRSARGRRRG